MARPYWSGQISISLVSFAVDIYPASTSSREFQFHQIDRKTGQRIHYQNVAGPSLEEEEQETGSGRHSLKIAGKNDDEDHKHLVAKSDIVKGFEYEKGKYAIIEPEELKKLRIPGTKSFEVTQFSSADEVHPRLYEKPYFVVPKKGPQAQAFAVVRQAMIDSGMVALGEIAFSGREHLAALGPPSDPKQLGMMLYTLRFAEELRDPASYFDDIETVKLDKRQSGLAKQLIESFTRPFKLDEFKDDYEEAVRELVEAKLENKPLPKEPGHPRAKVVDLMEALRRSLAAKQAPANHTSKDHGKNAASQGAKGKLKLVPAKRSKTA